MASFTTNKMSLSGRKKGSMARAVKLAATFAVYAIIFFGIVSMGNAVGALAQEALVPRAYSTTEGGGCSGSPTSLPAPSGTTTTEAVDGMSGTHTSPGFSTETTTTVGNLASESLSFMTMTSTVVTTSVGTAIIVGTLTFSVNTTDSESIAAPTVTNTMTSLLTITLTATAGVSGIEGSAVTDTTIITMTDSISGPSGSMTAISDSIVGTTTTATETTCHTMTGNGTVSTNSVDGISASIPFTPMGSGPTATGWTTMSINGSYTIPPAASTTSGFPTAGAVGMQDRTGIVIKIPFLVAIAAVLV
ncbi:hypothetical protein B0H66DRAFT_589945 [Apodospora peruviana]|uniref:Uncharacterized protein n=1 Tax=Apodospora peruviana TaxID=516989 RepID=A0AAE0M7D3_9PEZI|nr:hypothetical protein B0H66DRAFT_589945 [Apodospora peruviana]